ncbi:MAG TPA: DUF4197 family protein, partial [Saprospiraceae bacterium]|nr:DUF4197 family protein [Saprospiraceae bacterium]
MKKSLLLLLVIATLVSCDQATLNRALKTVLSGEITVADAAAGLKEALNIGISKGADALSKQDGYFKSAYKILLPPEARKITDKLKNVPGFSNVENVILEKINRGAEDAATKAKPIFMGAIRQMTF